MKQITFLGLVHYQVDMIIMIIHSEISQITSTLLCGFGILKPVIHGGCVEDYIMNVDQIVVHLIYTGENLEVLEALIQISNHSSVFIHLI